MAHFQPFGMCKLAYLSIRRAISDVLPSASSFARLMISARPAGLTRMFKGRRDVLGTADHAADHNTLELRKLANRCRIPHGPRPSIGEI